MVSSTNLSDTENSIIQKQPKLSKRSHNQKLLYVSLT